MRSRCSFCVSVNNMLARDQAVGVTSWTIGLCGDALEAAPGTVDHTGTAGPASPIICVGPLARKHDEPEAATGPPSNALELIANMGKGPVRSGTLVPKVLRLHSAVAY